MSDGQIQIAPDSTGKLVDCQTLTSGSNTVYRQTVTVGDPAALGSIQTVVAGNSAPMASHGAAVVTIRPDTTGSSGVDKSVNAPTWPVVGAGFSSGGLYPSWVLLATVAASPTRLNVTVDNMDPSLVVLVLRDDGTATTGNTLANATGFTLNPKVGAGPEGGHYESTTFRGRLQVFGSSSSQFVAISTD